MPPRPTPSLVLALVALVLGCDWLKPEGSSESLALFEVRIEDGLRGFDAIRFSVPARVDVKAHELEVAPANFPLNFGYYLPDVTGVIEIQALAIRRGGCGGGTPLRKGLGLLTTPALVRGEARMAGALLVEAREGNCPSEGNTEPPAVGMILRAGKVFDGDEAEDLDFQNHGASMVVRWADFMGGNIDGYEYTITAASDCSGPRLLQPMNLGTGMLRYEAKGLTLPAGKLYNCIRAFGGGKQSPWAASDGITLDFKPPTVLEVSPADKATGADRKGPIAVKFSEVVHPGALDGGLVITLAGATEIPVPVKLALDPAGTTLTATPEAALPILALVNVKVTAKVQDLARNPAAPSATSYTAADGTWSPAMTLEQHDNAALEGGAAPVLTVDGKGRVVIAWERAASDPGHASHLHLYRFDPAAGWSKPVQLIRKGFGRATNPQLAFGDSGRLYVAYQQGDDNQPMGPQSAWVHELAFDTSAGNDFRLDTLAGRQSALPTVAFGPGVGNAIKAITAWIRLDPTTRAVSIMARESLQEVGWQDPLEVDRGASPQSAKLGAKVVFDRLGNAQVIWMESDSPLDAAASGQVSARRFERDLGWQPVQRLSGAKPGVGMVPDVAVDAQGNAVALWTQNLGTDMTSAHGVFAAYFRAADRMWTPPARATATVATLFPIGGPRVAMNGAGAVVATWLSGTGELAVERFNGGTWSDKPVKQAGRYFLPAAGLDEQGRALVIWNSSFNVGDVLVARERADAGLGPPTKLNLEPMEVAMPSQLAVLPDGRAVAVWLEGKPNKLMISRFE